VEEIEVEPNTSEDEELACKIFGDLNRDLPRIPRDGILIILSDFEEEGEDADHTLVTTLPQSSVGSKSFVVVVVVEEEEQEEEQEEEEDDDDEEAHI
jgi:mRNA deadenylase 3'-5' endonuclease subunit Ccr4